MVSIGKHVILDGIDFAQPRFTQPDGVAYDGGMLVRQSEIDNFGRQLVETLQRTQGLQPGLWTFCSQRQVTKWFDRARVAAPDQHLLHQVTLWAVGRIEFLGETSRVELVEAGDRPRLRVFGI